MKKLLLNINSVFLALVAASVLFSRAATAELNPLYELDIAIDVDYEFVQLMGSKEAAQAQVYAYLDGADKMLREQVGVRLNLVFEHYWTTPQPYDSDALFPFSEFTNYWDEHYPRSVLGYEVAFWVAGAPVLNPITAVVFCNPPTGVTSFYGLIPTIDPLENSGPILSVDMQSVGFADVIGSGLGTESLTGTDACIDEDGDGIPPWVGCGGDLRVDRFHPGNIDLMREVLESESECISKVPGELNPVLPLAMTPKLGTASDTDGDGVANSIEASKGTNPNDRGSFTDQLKSPVYASWNSFLGVINILETINTGSSPLNVTATLFTLEGAQGEQISYSLSAGEQRDLIVNDMQGFSADTYGTLKLEFDGSLDGRVFYYQRDETLPGDYNFAFGIPFLDPTFGPSAVGFNTFQPSTNEDDEYLPVNNWLSIVNLSGSGQRFLIAKYDQLGKILGSSSVNIAPFGRHDIEAGHVTPGPNHVGLMRIVPMDNNAPYLAFVNRYGVGDEGQNKFAFPLVARSGTGETIHVPLSSRYTAQNWLEVMNSLNESTSVQVDIFNSSGAHLSSQAYFLGAFSQVHIDATSVLGAEGTGHAKIKGSKPDSILAQSMHYFRDPVGGIDALYGSQAREAFSSDMNGSYNLFLNMGAELTVVNTESSAYSGVVTTQKSDLSTAQSLLTLNATGNYINDLRTDPTFLLTPDTYGVVNISDSSVPVIAELVRVRISPYHGRVDFAAPTAIR